MNILVVDTIEHELHCLKKAFFHSKCQLHFITDVRYILRALNKLNFDVIILASRLDNATPQDVLKAVSQKYPSLVRVVINNTGDESKYQHIAHYNFLPPIDAAQICVTIESLAKRNKNITKDSIVKIVANIKSLPSPPKVYMQLNALLEGSNADSHKIAEIITQDPALTAKVLQVSNNFALNKGKPNQNISDAITKMGIDTLSCIVMTAELFSYEPNIPNFSLIDEQLHCLHTAKLAASLVKPEFKQEAMLAGLLHDIGKLILFEIDPKLTQQFLQNVNQTANTLLLEQKLFNTNHCQIGAYLLHYWSFPYSTIESIINHHSPEKLLEGRFGVAQAVYLANTLLRQQEPNELFVSHFKMTSIIDTLKARAEKIISP